MHVRTFQVQKRASDSMQLVFHSVASHHEGAGTKPWSSTEKHVLFTSEPNLSRYKSHLDFHLFLRQGFTI